MATNHFTEFDTILFNRRAIIEQYASRYDELKAEAENMIDAVYYGKHSLYLGHFCPSLIMEFVTGGFKRDRLKKTLSKNTKDYVCYEVDQRERLIRIKEVNSFGTVVETYLVKNGREEYSIAFMDGKPVSINDSVRTLFENDRVVRCDFIGSNSVWSEVYDYSDSASNLIRCTRYYYVPGLKNSDKNIEAGKEGSPMRQFEVKIETYPDASVRRLEYGELKDGKVNISFVYDAASK